MEVTGGTLDEAMRESLMFELREEENDMSNPEKGERDKGAC